MYNDAAGMVLGMRPDDTQNCVIDFFSRPAVPGAVRTLGEDAHTVVAQFRAWCAAAPDDEGYQEVLGELRDASPEFAALWEERGIEDAGQIRKELDHPLVGLLAVESTAMKVRRPDLTIVLHTPLPEANAAAKLERLASPEGRRGARCIPWRARSVRAASDPFVCSEHDRQQRA